MKNKMILLMIFSFFFNVFAQKTMTVHTAEGKQTYYLPKVDSITFDSSYISISPLLDDTAIVKIDNHTVINFSLMATPPIQTDSIIVTVQSVGGVIPNALLSVSIVETTKEISEGRITAAIYASNSCPLGEYQMEISVPNRGYIKEDPLVVIVK